MAPRPMDPRRGLVVTCVLWVLVALIAILAPPSTRLAQSAVANLGIFSTYVLIGVFIMPFVRAQLLVTKVSGVMFFLTCGLTHLHKFSHSLSGTPQDQAHFFETINHNVQLVAVFVFTMALYVEYIHGGPRSVWPPRLDFSRMFGSRKGDDEKGD